MDCNSIHFEILEIAFRCSERIASNLICLVDCRPSFTHSGTTRFWFHSVFRCRRKCFFFRPIDLRRNFYSKVHEIYRYGWAFCVTHSAVLVPKHLWARQKSNNWNNFMASSNRPNGTDVSAASRPQACARTHLHDEISIFFFSFSSVSVFFNLFAHFLFHMLHILPSATTNRNRQNRPAETG